MEYIGAYVKKFESGSKGSLSLGSSGYDYGLSCGSYQLTLRYGNCIAFLQHYFPNESASIYYNYDKEVISSKTWPGPEYCSTPEEVKQVWINCYNKAGKEPFFTYEHEWIKKSYYDRAKERIKEIIDTENTNRAFQEMIWSFSVNMGVGGCEKFFKQVAAEIDFSKYSHEKLFDYFYDKRYEALGLNRYKKNLFSGSSERETLRPLIKQKGLNVLEITSPLSEEKEEGDILQINITRYYQTKNDCYKKGAEMQPEGIVVHSTAANNPFLKRYVGPDDGKLGVNSYKNYWNKPNFKKCMNGFCGKLDDGTIAFYQTLPWNYKPWGCASGKKGSFNNTHIQFEICEDNLKNEQYFNEVFEMAINVCAYLCQEFGLEADKVVSHKEAAKLGYANNHSDPHNWLVKFNKDMNWFRDEVRKKIGTIEAVIDVYEDGTIKEEDYEQINIHGKVSVNGRLNCRKGPGTDFAVVDTIKDGTIVDITKKYDSWGFVERKNYWVSLNYIKETDLQEEKQEEIIQDSFKGRVVGGRLNVREKPSYEANIINQIPSGTIIEIGLLDDSNQWGFTLDYNGWVKLEYVERI